MTVVELTQEQEAIARAAMATGRYARPEEVIDAALALLREQERQRAEFAASVAAARERGEREGHHELDQVLAALDADEADDEARRAAP
jgi:Arc/MetJ-type ribon-helix-helix transcriptional regulator